jgi:hypothetical protein
MTDNPVSFIRIPKVPSCESESSRNFTSGLVLLEDWTGRRQIMFERHKENYPFFLIPYVGPGRSLQSQRTAVLVYNSNALRPFWSGQMWHGFGREREREEK